MQYGAAGIERDRALQPFLSAADVARLFLRHRQLEQRADVVRVVLQQRRKLFDRLRLLAKQRIRAAQLPA